MAAICSPAIAAKVSNYQLFSALRVHFSLIWAGCRSGVWRPAENQHICKKECPADWFEGRNRCKGSKWLVGHAGPIYRAIKFIPIIQPLQKELQNLEDASGDIMLLDDDQSIPYPPRYCMFSDLSFFLALQWPSPNAWFRGTIQKLAIYHSSCI